MALHETFIICLCTYMYACRHTLADGPYAADPEAHTILGLTCMRTRTQSKTPLPLSFQRRYDYQTDTPYV